MNGYQNLTQKSLLNCFYSLQEKLSSSAFNEKPRPIPARSFFVKIVPGMIVGGILPFGCIFIESFFVMNSIW